jgi:hypothetical protein
MENCHCRECPFGGYESGRWSRAQPQLSGFQLLRGVTDAPPDGFLIDGHEDEQPEPLAGQKTHRVTGFSSMDTDRE